jgi:hypothetical protein
MNLLISSHSIFWDEESSRQAEEVEDARREDLEVAGREESSNGELEDFEEEDNDDEEGYEEGAGWTTMGWR